MIPYSNEGLPETEGAPLVERVSERLFDILNPPKPPVPRYYIGSTPISTPGNLTAVSAPPKSGKSSFIGAMLAATMAPNPEAVDCLGVHARNHEGHAVIRIDTEQSLYDAHEQTVRSLKRAGIPAPPKWLRSYCLTGFSVPDSRQAIRLILKQARQDFGGIHSLLLDGVADLVIDVNDSSECGVFVGDLQGLAIAYSCPIVGIIHLNPGTDKTRGHLGSQLERKAETNLRLHWDGDSIVVWSDKNRRAPIAKKHGPRFVWSNELQMHVSTQCVGDAKASMERTLLQTEAKAVFASEGQEALRWREFLTSLQKLHGLSESGARKKIARMVGASVICKNPAGSYTLAQ